MMICYPELQGQQRRDLTMSRVDPAARLVGLRGLCRFTQSGSKVWKSRACVGCPILGKLYKDPDK